jgi:subtilase family serine protease
MHRTCCTSIVAATFVAGFAFHSVAQGNSPAANGQPLNWEAHPPLHAKPDASNSPTGYVPLQIRHAYGLDQLTNGGAGQVIAVVDAFGSPTLQNDLNVFCDQFGLPRTTLQFVYGGARTKRTDAGWALETSLDVEWAHALAPKAKIIVAVAGSASTANLTAAIDAAVNAGATIVSMSWGGSEFSSQASYESHFQHSGVTFLASSGDNGSGASWPATSPSVVSVGGTTLPLDAVGNLTSPESGWSGSGGGFSSYFNRPSWQNGWQTNAYRAFPDVALVADPATGVAVYDTTSYNGKSGWFKVGGTSASCPMWGAIVALANEQRVASGAPLLTGSDAALYSVAGSTETSGASLYGFFFFDVSSGSNGGFSATPKFDEVTGLGSPVTVNLVPGMAAY